MRHRIYLISREIFYVMSFGSFILAVLELIKPRMVLAWLNLNWWLAVWLASGIIVRALKVKAKR